MTSSLALPSRVTRSAADDADDVPAAPKPRARRKTSAVRRDHDRRRFPPHSTRASRFRATSRALEPLRGGLIDIFKYEDQEFRYEDGSWLILRGNNGTGKSRVLALQFPFLLDGDVAPHRLEPTATRRRRRVEPADGALSRTDRLCWPSSAGAIRVGPSIYPLTIGCGLLAETDEGLLIDGSS